MLTLEAGSQKGCYYELCNLSEILKKVLYFHFHVCKSNFVVLCNAVFFNTFPDHGNPFLTK
jgi:hypothetical protein